MHSGHRAEEVEGGTEEMKVHFFQKEFKRQFEKNSLSVKMVCPLRNEDLVLCTLWYTSYLSLTSWDGGDRCVKGKIIFTFFFTSPSGSCRRCRWLPVLLRSSYTGSIEPTVSSSLLYLVCPGTMLGLVMGHVTWFNVVHSVKGSFVVSEGHVQVIAASPFKIQSIWWIITGKMTFLHN